METGRCNSQGRSIEAMIILQLARSDQYSDSSPARSSRERIPAAISGAVFVAEKTQLESILIATHRHARAIQSGYAARAAPLQNRHQVVEEKRSQEWCANISRDDATARATSTLRNHACRAMQKDASPSPFVT